MATSRLGMPSDNERRQKRVTVRAACEECRLRKTKCDGARPVCGRCETRRQPCVYSTGPEESRNEALRRIWQAREEQFNSLLSILNLLQRGSEEQALIALQRIRSATNISSILSSTTSSDAQTIESLRQLYTDAQATVAKHSTSRVTSPVSEASTSRPRSDSRAGSESSAGSRKLQSREDSKISRLTLDYIINDGANTNTSNRRASASDTEPCAATMETLRNSSSAPTSHEPARNALNSDWNMYYSNVSTLLHSLQKSGAERPL
ncbi:hypothetical protein AC578_2633 [Pseudocercospora eumusae]|uniref:Zn(2)-C6 fungal-type domain-containing protein n=1 Tax=Pseudocercospora eumusae TaxID=321146 RepID=A0A139H0I7_9PEZI|nr:hypothetical protein AC578_2633 [Pseudocercospora eumusae]